MKQPSICNSTKQKPSLPEFCDDGLWEVPVNSLSDIKQANRDHAYILPDNSVWVLSYDGKRFIQLNVQGGSGGGQPTQIENKDGLIHVSGSGTYAVQLDLNKEQLKEELAIDDLSEEMKNHFNNSNIHVTKAEKAEWHAKQEALTAGENITIINEVISATDSQKVTDHLNDGGIHVSAAEKAQWNSKQEKLTAGDNITIVDDRISADLSSKQDVLVSGTNIKTINGQSVLGSGDITISGGFGEKLFLVNQLNPLENDTYSAAIDNISINISKTSRSEWLLTVTNNHTEQATVAYHFAAFYSTALQTGGNTSSLITLNAGETSPTLDIDNLGLGYGSAKLSIYEHYIHVYIDATKESNYYKVTSMLDKSMTGWHLMSYLEKII